LGCFPQEKGNPNTMADVLRFFRSYEIWIYLILGVLALWQIRKFVIAWEEVRGAAFGLEREAAQFRLNQASVTLLLLLLMSVSEFTLVYIVAPSVPGAIPIPSPTLNLLATATAVLPLETPNPDLMATPTLNPGDSQLTGQGCVPGSVAITFPKEGDTVSGVVKVEGTADIPDFGFYKYEISRPNDSIWLSLNAGEAPVRDGVLGEWITDMLPEGDYMLRLVVVDNKGQTLPACIIQVRVSQPQN
jgi:hypothetical protein